MFQLTDVKTTSKRTNKSGKLATLIIIGGMFGTQNSNFILRYID